MVHHLEQNGMTYAQHLAFALKLGGVLFLLSVTALIHGVVPFVLTERVSTTIKRLAASL
jgi:hypothetical protein